MRRELFVVEPLATRGTSTVKTWAIPRGNTALERLGVGDGKLG
jgi:hypothetical protein